jgi:hypothetical protein
MLHVSRLFSQTINPQTAATIWPASKTATVAITLPRHDSRAHDNTSGSTCPGWLVITRPLGRER